MVAPLHYHCSTMELFKQATIVVDNARSHVASEAYQQHAEIPALCHFSSGKAPRKNRSKSLPSRKNKRRTGSFPPAEYSRWEGTLMSANSMSLSPPIKPLSRRRNSSDGIICSMETTAVSLYQAVIVADCLPRQPRREPSLRTISLLDDALDVINSIELSA